MVEDIGQGKNISELSQRVDAIDKARRENID